MFLFEMSSRLVYAPADALASHWRPRATCRCGCTCASRASLPATKERNALSAVMSSHVAQWVIDERARPWSCRAPRALCRRTSEGLDLGGNTAPFTQARALAPSVAPRPHVAARRR